MAGQTLLFFTITIANFFIHRATLFTLDALNKGV
jgi:hypothetical protein